MELGQDHIAQGPMPPTRVPCPPPSPKRERKGGEGGKVWRGGGNCVSAKGGRGAIGRGEGGDRAGEGGVPWGHGRFRRWFPPFSLDMPPVCLPACPDLHPPPLPPPAVLLPVLRLLPVSWKLPSVSCWSTRTESPSWRSNWLRY